ncbi:cation:proton antiporter [Candidatus Woesebacteria bacterium]|nr:cation:proton antiporter [Candidatus Woesebacteria bacterium]
MSFAELALLLVVAAAAGVVAKAIKQPLLIGYLFAGLLLAFFGVVRDFEAIAALGKVGVALLLFLVGLEMNVRELPSLGKVALMTGLGQIIFTSVVGYLIAFALGFGVLPSIYIAVALTFSSTIIIVKLLSEKGDIGSLYGKIAVGFLLVQDFVAILILMFLAGLGGKEANLGQFFLIGVKAIALLASVWFLSKKVLPTLFDKFIASSPEILFVGSIAWALGVAALVGGPLGFSYEIGGFLAGLALSNLPEHLGIASKTRPLRDFFLTIFFLTLGTQLLVKNIGAVIAPAVVFSLFVLIGNPLIVLIIMGLLRYKKRTSFLASVTVAQISEFSFILMAMGLTLGHVSQTEVATVILVGVITMTISTYLILASDKIFLKLKDTLSIFERRLTHEMALLTEKIYNDHIVLIGCDRMGKALISFFKKKGLLYLVVDHNPKVFANLSAERIPVLLGDIDDPEIKDLAKMDKARMVISTISNTSDNLSILEYIRNLTRRPLAITKAFSKAEALKQYEAGAAFVLLPEVIAGEYLRHLFVAHGISEERIRKMGKGHFNRLITSK